MWLRRTQDLYKMTRNSLRAYHDFYRFDKAGVQFPSEQALLDACLEIRQEHMAIRQDIIDADPEISGADLDELFFEKLNGVCIRERRRMVTANGSKIHRFRTRTVKKVDEEESVDDGRSDDDITEEEALAEIRRAASERKRVEEKPKRDILKVRETWKDPVIAEARSTRHNCQVTIGDNSRLFRSVNAAFKALGLPENKAASFRGKLKRLMNCTLQVDERIYHFSLVETNKVERRNWTSPDNKRYESKGASPVEGVVSHAVKPEHRVPVTEQVDTPKPKATKQPTANDIAKAQLAAMKEEELSEVEKDPLFTTAEQLKEMSPEEQLALYRQQQRIKRERLAQKG